jgi:hypothetical protein
MRKILVLLLLLTPFISYGQIGQVCTVNRGTPAQTIANGILRTITWNVERDDIQGWFSPGARDRITVTQAGIYAVSCSTAWDVNGTGKRYVHLEKIEYGAPKQEVLDGHSRVAFDESTGHLFWQGRANAFTSFRIVVLQNSGAARTFGGYNRTSGNPPFSSTNTEFSVVRIR